VPAAPVVPASIFVPPAPAGDPVPVERPVPVDRPAPAVPAAAAASAQPAVPVATIVPAAATAHVPQALYVPAAPNAYQSIAVQSLPESTPGVDSRNPGDRRVPADRRGLMFAPALGVSADRSPAAQATPAPATSPARDTAPSDRSATDIVQSLRVLSSQGGGEVRIRLEPHHFGDLTLSVRVESGRVVTQVASDSAVVREWLQTHHGLLRQALHDQGLTLERFDVREPPGSEHGRDRRDPGDRQADDRERRRRPDEPGATFEVVA
jgi:flagellar hook-length control protein FliK